jgi:hypothetical protein
MTIMACEPFNIITYETESNTFQGWELLKEEYEPSMDEALISIQEKCVTCNTTAFRYEAYYLHSA